DGSRQNIWSSLDKGAQLTSLAFDIIGRQIAFVVENHTDSKTPNSIWYWRKGMAKAEIKVNDQIKEMNENLIMQGPLTFLNEGRLLMFKLKPKTDVRTPDPDAVKVDIWSYKDMVLQSSQPF